MTASIKSHGVGATLVLTLSNPQNRNALTPELYAAAVEAFNAADSNPEVRSIVLVGEGSHFCSGLDLQRLQAMRQLSPQTLTDSLDGLEGWVEAIHSCSKPVLAAVEGSCSGAGFALALAADFLIAADNSIFRMDCARQGLSPAAGGSWHLLRALPRATALQLLMCGDAVDAGRLQQLGLANRVSAAGQALAQALALAETLNDQAANVLASIKELANEAAEHSLAQQMRAEHLHFMRNLHHANGGEGIQAMQAQRPPRFR